MDAWKPPTTSTFPKRSVWATDGDVREDASAWDSHAAATFAEPSLDLNSIVQAVCADPELAGAQPQAGQGPPFPPDTGGELAAAPIPPHNILVHMAVKEALATDARPPPEPGLDLRIPSAVGPCPRDEATSSALHSDGHVAGWAAAASPSPDPLPPSVLAPRPQFIGGPELRQAPATAGLDFAAWPAWAHVYDPDRPLVPVKQDPVWASKGGPRSAQEPPMWSGPQDRRTPQVQQSLTLQEQQSPTADSLIASMVATCTGGAGAEGTAHPLPVPVRDLGHERLSRAAPVKYTPTVNYSSKKQNFLVNEESGAGASSPSTLQMLVGYADKAREGMVREAARVMQAQKEEKQGVGSTEVPKSVEGGVKEEKKKGDGKSNPKHKTHKEDEKDVKEWVKREKETKDKEAEREREREKTKEKEKEREREREKERERMREKEKEKERERAREKEKERARERERVKEREKEREREKKREEERKQKRVEKNKESEKEQESMRGKERNVEPDRGVKTKGDTSKSKGKPAAGERDARQEQSEEEVQCSLSACACLRRHASPFPLGTGADQRGWVWSSDRL